ncbi:hypothetical protein C9374_005057 [Naegleria lovaniensis]|uniref:Uncharacterized protein n=1 Tax=Naegleria lovaniensis TaxID=51637 RepID=A0AA88GQF2_NAELO|nr:uncharacterized protein C9374_005057 [Naegleria lovaniensis]KAG2382477.1 hypothetical protein C9374_005057 [Naegleria lovaniensis]
MKRIVKSILRHHNHSNIATFSLGTRVFRTFSSTPSIRSIQHQDDEWIHHPPMIPIPSVPGLFKIKDFISPNERDHVMSEMKHIQQQLIHYFQHPEGAKELFVSQYHNLTSKESFQKVKLEELSQGEKPYFVEVFEQYGHEGHCLVYCRNSNLPKFTKEIIQKKLLQHPQTKQLVIENVREEIRKMLLMASNEEMSTVKTSQDVFSNIDWKVALNFYKVKDNHLSGFSFHRDIASNGNITAILALQSYGMLEFKKPNVEYDGFKPKENQSNEQQLVERHLEEDHETSKVLVEPRTLLILSGEARWDYLHRVPPLEKEFEFEGKKYVREDSRWSVVFGCK